MIFDVTIISCFGVSLEDSEFNWSTSLDCASDQTIPSSLPLSLGLSTL